MVGRSESTKTCQNTIRTIKNYCLSLFFFAKQGKHVALTPKLTRSPKFEYAQIYGSLIGTRYEGKCPDMLIDGEWYEHEGFTSDNPKNAFRNMLTHGLKQSSRLIIESPKLTDRYMKRIINNRIASNQEINEILILENSGEIRVLYKKQMVDISINQCWQRIGSH